MKRVLISLLAVVLFASIANAQKAEITISLNEQFFEALLDAMFQNAAPPEFAISQNLESEDPAPSSSGRLWGGSFNYFAPGTLLNPPCNETIRLLRETGASRTAVRLRDGKISAPIAFSGNYNPPLIGCVEFSGVADADIVLEFDQDTQRLVGRAKVTNVALNGTGGIGGGLIARMVQGSIDKKINPIEIIKMDKISFIVPIQNSGSLRMKATGIRHDIGGGVLNVHIAYEFQKGP